MQIRKYAATSWAVTDVAMDDWNAAINNGFRNLFKYISGFNEGHQLIPMAVPGMAGAQYFEAKADASLLSLMPSQ